MVRQKTPKSIIPLPAPHNWDRVRRHLSANNGDTSGRALDATPTKRDWTTSRALPPSVPQVPCPARVRQGTHGSHAPFIANTAPALPRYARNAPSTPQSPCNTTMRVVHAPGVLWHCCVDELVFPPTIERKPCCFCANDSSPDGWHLKLKIKETEPGQELVEAGVLWGCFPCLPSRPFLLKGPRLSSWR